MAQMAQKVAGSSTTTKVTTVGHLNKVLNPQMLKIVFSHNCNVALDKSFCKTLKNANVAAQNTFFKTNEEQDIKI